MRVACYLVVSFLMTVNAVAGQVNERPTSGIHPRTAVFGGMGVVYINADDIVSLVSAASGGVRQSDFKASVIFFGGVSVPLSLDWALKFEYGYLLGSYTIPGAFGSSEYTVAVHLPSLVVQYILLEEGRYNVKAGCGVGYHIGELATKGFASGNDSYSGSGVGTLLELEANTAFGEDFFGFIGAEMRWDFIGRLTSTTGRSPAPSETTLQFFGLGVKFGFTYYF